MKLTNFFFSIKPSTTYDANSISEKIYNNQQPIYFDTWLNSTPSTLELSIPSQIQAFTNDFIFKEFKKQLNTLIDNLYNWCRTNKIKNANDWQTFKININANSETISADILIVLYTTTKRALEKICFFYTIEKSDINLKKNIMNNFISEDRLILCLAGAHIGLMHMEIRIKDNSWANIFHKIKYEIIQELATEYAIKKLNIEYSGNEIHHINALFNHVAEKLGLNQITDNLSPINLNHMTLKLYDSFLENIDLQLSTLIINNLVENSVNFFSLNTTNNILNFTNYLNEIAPDDTFSIHSILNESSSQPLVLQKNAQMYIRTTLIKRFISAKYLEAELLIIDVNDKEKLYLLPDKLSWSWHENEDTLIPLEKDDYKIILNYNKDFIDTNNLFPLAALHNQQQAIINMLAQGANPFTTYQDPEKRYYKFTALHFAIQNANDCLIKLLRPNYPQKFIEEDETLFNIIQNTLNDCDDTSSIETIASINLYIQNSYAIFVTAQDNNYILCQKLLCQSNYITNLFINNKSALNYAIDHENILLLKTLLVHGFSPTRYNSMCENAITYCIQQKKVNCLEILIKDTDLEASPKLLQHVLINAAQYNWFYIFQTITNKTYYKNIFYTPLESGIIYNNKYIVKNILSKNINPLNVSYLHKKSALSIAIAHNSHVILNILLEHVIENICTQSTVETHQHILAEYIFECVKHDKDTALNIMLEYSNIIKNQIKTLEHAITHNNPYLLKTLLSKTNILENINTDEFVKLFYSYKRAKSLIILINNLPPYYLNTSLLENVLAIATQFNLTYCVKKILDLPIQSSWMLNQDAQQRSIKNTISHKNIQLLYLLLARIHINASTIKILQDILNFAIDNNHYISAEILEDFINNCSANNFNYWYTTKIAYQAQKLSPANLVNKSKLKEILNTNDANKLYYYLQAHKQNVTIFLEPQDLKNAIDNEQEDIFILLLEHGANPLKEVEISNAHINILDYVIKHPDLKWFIIVTNYIKSHNITNTQICNAISVSCRENKTYITEALTTLLNKLNLDVSINNTDDENALDWAVFHNNICSIHNLLSIGYNLKRLFISSPRGYHSAFSLALKKGHYDVAQILLVNDKYKIRPHTITIDIINNLVIHGQRDLLKFTIKCIDSYSPLQLAAFKASFNIEEPCPLNLAFKNNAWEFAELLINNNLNDENDYGQFKQALSYVAKYDKENLFNKLLTINAQRYFHYLIQNQVALSGGFLHYAVNTRSKLMLKLFTNPTLGLDINHQNHNKQTALHLAAKSKDLATVKFLLKQGADLNVVDNHNRTPNLWFSFASSRLKLTINIKKLISKKQLASKI